MAGVTPPAPDYETIYANWISAQTGIDPRVILAQARSEGHPGDESGYNNWLNIQARTAEYYHVPVSGVGPADTAMFSSILNSEKAAYDTYKGLGLTKEKGKSINQQIQDIGASGWASSHYGSPPGEHILENFHSMYPDVDVGGIATQNGVPATPGSSTGGPQSGGSLTKTLTSPFSGIGSGIEAFGYQALFVIIGLGLILVGLGLIAWTVMGRVGGGPVGMVQTQMRINQAGSRLEESQRASSVRESQATERIGGQREQRELSRERLQVQERHLRRRESEPTNVIYPVQERVSRNRGKMA